MASSGEQQMHHLQELHAKAQHYLELKLNKIPRHLRPKLTIEDVYRGAGPNITLKNVPSDLQLQFFFERFNDIARAGNNARVDNADFDITRAVWFYDLDHKHHNSNASFSNTKCNLWVMAILAARNGFVNGTQIPLLARNFVMTFLHRWAEAIWNKDISSMDDWVKGIWRSGQYDLIYFRRSELGLILKEVKKLAPKINAMRVSRPKAPLFFLGNHYNEDDAPKMALEYVSHHANLDKEGNEAGQDQDQDMDMEMDIDQPETDLRSVDWNERFLNSVLQEPEVDVVVQAGVLSAVQTYITVSEAINLVKVSDVDKIADEICNMVIAS